MCLCVCERERGTCPFQFAFLGARTRLCKEADLLLQLAAETLARDARPRLLRNASALRGPQDEPIGAEPLACALTRPNKLA